MPDSLSELEDFKTLKMDVYDDPLLKIRQRIITKEIIQF